MKGLIVMNAYPKGEKFYRQSGRIKEELEKLDVETDVLLNGETISKLTENCGIDTSATAYDFVVYLDKDKYISEMLEKSGVKLFNCHTAIRDCDDKMQTYIALSGKGVPMVKTLSGLLCYSPGEQVKEETLDKLENALGYPIIVKESFGSLGKGVYMAKNRDELRELAQRLKCSPHLFQQTVQTSVGRDIRVILVGGKYLCAMLRQSSGDFRSNIELGGSATAYTPSQEVIEVCEKTAEVLGLDYCGIDILFGEDGPLVCEVNSNAFFGGMENATGVNVAKAYAKHMYQTVYGKGE